MAFRCSVQELLVVGGSPSFGQLFEPIPEGGVVNPGVLCIADKRSFSSDGPGLDLSLRMQSVRGAISLPFVSADQKIELKEREIVQTFTGRELCDAANAALSGQGFLLGASSRA